MKKAEALKQAHNDNVLTADKALLIILGVEFGEKEKKVNSVKLSYKKIRDYIDTSLPQEQVEEHIINALEFYKTSGMKEM
jgi:hypothetical protein